MTTRGWYAERREAWRRVTPGGVSSLERAWAFGLVGRVVRGAVERAGGTARALCCGLGQPARQQRHRHPRGGRVGRVGRVSVWWPL